MPPEIVALPPLSAPPTAAAYAIGQRRRCRTFDGSPISPDNLGRLLWAGQGISDPDGARTVPSAGQQYPLTLFVATEPAGPLGGVCRYRPSGHAVDHLDPHDLRARLQATAIGDQPWVGAAAVVLVIAATLDKITEHFFDQQPDGQRGVRYAHLEAGAAAQNIAIQATELGLGSVLVGGFDDEAVRRTLGDDTAVTPLALMAIGRPSAPT